MEKKPTYEQAKLHLKVYDLRREPRLRQARDWFFKNVHVQTFDEFICLAAPGTDSGAMTRMVLSYWENVCALLNYDLLHEDLFFKTSAEFFGVWDMIKHIVPAARKRFSDNQYLENLEKAAQRYETWKERNAPGHIAAIREFMKSMMTQPEMRKTA